MIIGKNRYNLYFFNKLAIILILATLSHFSNAQQERDLLTDHYSLKFIEESVPNNNSWINYPDYKNREIWDKIPEEIKQTIVTNGEEYLRHNWPTVSATSYLDYTRTGSRNATQDIIKARTKALHSLVFAELVEGKGKFL